MATDLLFEDPYDGNPLTSVLGPLVSPKMALERLHCIPSVPPEIANQPKHVRLHFLMKLRDLHFPSPEEGRLGLTIDLMMRQGYRYRDPRDPRSWRLIGDAKYLSAIPTHPATAAVAVGLSGVGKTQAIKLLLSGYPGQIVVHENFPHLVGPHGQVVWQSIDVPPSGRAIDLATNLMVEWDRSTGWERFKDSWRSSQRNAAKLLEEWRAVALSHHLGILHLDEVQNFFKLATLKQRSRRGPDGPPELSIVEDFCLKWLLVLMNTCQISLLISGTPDGVGALTRRFANAQRFATSGYHCFERFESGENSESEVFRKGIFAQLIQHQYVKQGLPLPEKKDELAALLLELSGGIPRIIIALWIAAHRVAYGRKNDDDSLTFQDFRVAASTYLAPVQAAVQALNSNSPERMSRYEDLVPRDDAFWSKLWTQVAIM